MSENSRLYFLLRKILEELKKPLVSGYIRDFELIAPGWAATPKYAKTSPPTNMQWEFLSGLFDHTNLVDTVVDLYSSNSEGIVFASHVVKAASVSDSYLTDFKGQRILLREWDQLRYYSDTGNHFTFRILETTV